jgi:hypothetical protein
MKIAQVLVALTLVATVCSQELTISFMQSNLTVLDDLCNLYVEETFTFTASQNVTVFVREIPDYTTFSNYATINSFTILNSSAPISLTERPHPSLAAQIRAIFTNPVITGTTVTLSWSYYLSGPLKQFQTSTKAYWSLTMNYPVTSTKTIFNFPQFFSNFNLNQFSVNQSTNADPVTQTKIVTYSTNSGAFQQNVPTVTVPQIAGIGCGGNTPQTGLSGGAIAGIVIGCIAAFILVVWEVIGLILIPIFGWQIGVGWMCFPFLIFAFFAK